MNEYRDLLCRGVLNGEIDLSFIPREMRLSDSSFYCYANRYARGCSTPLEAKEKWYFVLEDDIEHCTDKNTREQLQKMLKSYRYLDKRQQLKCISK